MSGPEYRVPEFSSDACALDPETTTVVHGSMIRLLHALSYERRTGKRWDGEGLFDKLFSAENVCVFEKWPELAERIWQVVLSGEVKLDYRASPMGLHAGQWGYARFMSNVALSTIFATPASRFRQMKIVRTGGELDIVQSPHKSVEECLLHELSHLAGADEAEAVAIGNAAPSITDLRLEVYDASWLGEPLEPF